MNRPAIWTFSRAVSISFTLMQRQYALMRVNDFTTVSNTKSYCLKRLRFAIEKMFRIVLHLKVKKFEFLHPSEARLHNAQYLSKRAASSTVSTKEKLEHPACLCSQTLFFSFFSAYCRSEHFFPRTALTMAHMFWKHGETKC